MYGRHITLIFDEGIVGSELRITTYVTGTPGMSEKEWTDKAYKQIKYIINTREISRSY